MTADLESQSDPALRGSSPADVTEAAAPGGLRRARWVDERPLVGKIGRYDVLGQLAGGGMGSVFVAQMSGPAQFSRRVAIKCLHTRWLDDPKYLARFKTEVKLSALIRHPNVVQTLDVVEDGGELFLVMEYVDGVTLAALLADLSRCGRSLPVQLALNIMAAVLRGLHAAHEATDENGMPCHIVHRDVSPQNIMLSKNGHVQVLDFGAAKAVEHSQHTAAGVLVGKLAYMAPEQVRGERSSPRTDVFSAGVVLWEALVGQRLFYDPSHARGELLHALVQKPVTAPSRLRADVPREVDAVVKKALQRNPQRRYQTALEFASALEAAGASRAGDAVSQLVLEVCATRLAEKEALLRAGLAALAEASASTPVPHALVVPSQERTPPGPSSSLASTGARHGLSRLGRSLLRRSGASAGLPARLEPRRVGASMSWLGGALLAGLGLWWGASAREDIVHEQRALRGSSLDDVPGERSRGGAHRDGDPRERRSTSEEPHDLNEPSESDDVGPQGIVVRLPAEPASSPSAPSSSAASSRAQPVPEVGQRHAATGPRRARRSDPSTRSASNGPLRGPASSAATPASASADCDPPTYMDAAGIRHFKKDCL